MLQSGKSVTPEADELALLLVLVKDEDKHIRIPEVNPIEVIKLKKRCTGRAQLENGFHICWICSVKITLSCR